MEVLIVLLLLGAAVCFGLAAGNVVSRVNPLGLGLLFWVVAELAPAVQRM